MTLLEHRQAIDRLDRRHRGAPERAHPATPSKSATLKLKQGEEIYAPAPRAHRAEPHRPAQPGPADRRRRSAPSTARSCPARSRSRSPSPSPTSAPRRPSPTRPRCSASATASATCRSRPSPKSSPRSPKRHADFGVVPVENSTEGVVTHTLDMFMDSDLKIVAQILLPISQCLMSRVARPQIKRLFIHPQSLAQCRVWLQRHFPDVELIETASNARSAELAAQEKRRGRHRRPPRRREVRPARPRTQRPGQRGERHPLPRARPPVPSAEPATTAPVSCSASPTVPGALHGAIAPFRKYRINMTKIESRPSKRKAWQYYFFVDCDGHAQDPEGGQGPRSARAALRVRQGARFLPEHGVGRTGDSPAAERRPAAREGGPSWSGLQPLEVEFQPGVLPQKLFHRQRAAPAARLPAQDRGQGAVDRARHGGVA